MAWCCCFKRSSSSRRDYNLENAPAQEAAILPKAFIDTKFNEKESFFVVTAIFNPASYKSRYDLYHKFAQHMEECGAQLITIECIFPTLQQNEFQVTNARNPNHIQLKSASVYWVKESLINVATSRLPTHAKYVCWLDADIQFHDVNWIENAIAELQKYSIVQIFEKADFLGPTGEILRTDYSFGYSVVHQKPIDQSRYDEWYPHSGYGWATSLNTFRQIGGLPDYDILGSGDLHFAFSLLNRVTNALEKNLNPQFKEFIVKKSQNTFLKLNDVSKQESKQMVGYVPLTINHNWHGSRKHRQYVNRWKILIAHDFNFLRDIRKTEDGLLQFMINEQELEDERPSIQDDIVVYFAMRNEDDVEYESEDNLVTLKKKKKKKKTLKKRGKKKLKIKSAPFLDDVDAYSGDSSNSRSGSDVGSSTSRSSGDSKQPGISSSSDDDVEEPGPGDDKSDDSYASAEGSAAVVGYIQDYGGDIQTTSQY